MGVLLTTASSQSRTLKAKSESLKITSAEIIDLRRQIKLL